MNIEQLLSQITDIGIEDSTLDAVLNHLFVGDIDVRKLVLPSDKKVEGKSDPAINDTRVKYEVLIFKATVKKLEEISSERLNGFGIDRTTLSKLKLLNDEQIKNYISKSIIPNNDKTLTSSIALIYGMSRLTDMFGSQKDNVFETKEQVTKYRKSNKRPEKYTKRIYMNIPRNSVGLEFLTLFKLKCIEKGIPSKMKGMGSSGYEDGDLDTTVIYSNDHYLLEHISILESMIQDRPDLFKKMGTPVISGGRVKSNDGNCYYTLSSGLLSDTTSNTYYDKLYKISFAVICAKINSSTKVDANLINEFHAMNKKELDNFIHSQKNILIQNIKDEHISKEIVIQEYKQIVKIVSSYLRFGDIDHYDVPIYQDEIFSSFLKNRSVKISATTRPSEDLDVKEMVLYDTEVLFEKAFQQYKSSELSLDESAKRYVKRSLSILSEYRRLVRQTIGFPGSQRHKIVSEYIKHIPIFKPFEPDPSKGDYINKVNEKKYYLEIAKELNNWSPNSSDELKNKNKR